MNNRIEELIRECEDFGDWETVRYTFDKEKFAKLIVKECCETVERRYKYSNGTPVSFWQMSQDVQDLLKEHFGVEE